MNITIYATTSCPFCKMLETYLEEKNIKFVKKIVDQDDVARKELEGQSNGFLGVPFTVVVKEDGSKEQIIGFDQNKVNSVLGI